VKPATPPPSGDGLPDGKSRSRKKRESAAAQRLGSALAALPAAELPDMDLPEALVAAILDWKKFPGHEAKRRQMQYIGKLMREADVEELEEKLETRFIPDREQTKTLHAVEELRDRLVNAEEAALEAELAALAARNPALPAARLRHLALTARDERSRQRPPKAYRELFRLLRGLF
jgi:ribosome-associated protein